MPDVTPSMPDVAPPGVLDGATAHILQAAAASRIVLRFDAGHPVAQSTFSSVLGVALGQPVNWATSAPTGSRAALRLGPDEWMILAEPGVAGDLIAALAGAADGLAHSAVDVSHRHAALIVTGRGAEDVLAAGCPLPLEPKFFPVGRATRTLFDKAEIVLWRHAGDRFHIEMGRSFSPYVTGLIEVAIEHETAIAALAASRRR